eukprot:13731391-Heterocapsa_arctica.AAC.1
MRRPFQNVAEVPGPAIALTATSQGTKGRHCSSLETKRYNVMHHGRPASKVRNAVPQFAAPHLVESDDARKPMC